MGQGKLSPAYPDCQKCQFDVRLALACGIYTVKKADRCKSYHDRDRQHEITTGRRRRENLILYLQGLV